MPYAHATAVYTELVAGEGEANAHISGNHSFFQHTWATYRRFVSQMKSTPIDTSSSGKSTTSLGHDYDLLANLYLHASLPALTIDNVATQFNNYRARGTATGCFSTNFTDGQGNAATTSARIAYRFTGNPAVGDKLTIGGIGSEPDTVITIGAANAGAPILSNVAPYAATMHPATLALADVMNALVTLFSRTLNVNGATFILPTVAHPQFAIRTPVVDNNNNVIGVIIMYSSFGNRDPNDTVSNGGLHVTPGAGQGTWSRSLPVVGDVIAAGNNGVSWIEYVGFRMIKSVSLKVEDQTIQKLSGDFLLLHAELTGGGTGLKRCQDLEMCGKAGGNQSCTVFVPIAFWWTREYSSSFPIVALNFNDITLKLELESIENLIVVTSNTAVVTIGGVPTTSSAARWDTSGFNLNWVQEALYLSDAERDQVSGTNLSIDCNTQFATDVLNVNRLVEQCQEFTTTLGSGLDHKVELPFNHLTKYLIITLYDPNENWSGNFTTFRALDRVQLDLNTNQRWGNINLGEGYNKTLWSHVVPYQSFDCIPRIANIYALSHALHGPAYQPSGVVNFSRIQKVHLRMQFDTAPPANMQLRVYCVNYNVLATENGTGGIVFNS